MGLWGVSWGNRSRGGLLRADQLEGERQKQHARKGKGRREAVHVVWERDVCALKRVSKRSTESDRETPSTHTHRAHRAHTHTH